MPLYFKAPDHPVRSGREQAGTVLRLYREYQNRRSDHDASAGRSEYFEDEYYTALDLDLGKKAFKMTFTSEARQDRRGSDHLPTDLGSFQPRWCGGPVRSISNCLGSRPIPNLISTEEPEAARHAHGFQFRGGFLNMTDSPDSISGLSSTESHDYRE